jgi:hypothetical protein
MNKDQLWMTIRYLMIAGGGYLAGKGYLRHEDVGPISDALITLAPFALSLGAAVWGFFVRHNTVIIPAAEVKPGQSVVDAGTGTSVPVKKE